MNPSSRESSPQFSIVSAAYNVKRYLNDFLDSIEQQTLPLDRIELIAVNDGSTDGTGNYLRQYAETAPFRMTIVDKENGGQSSARNVGLEHVSGEWVTFTDPDDFLDHDFFANTARFIENNPTVDLILFNNILFQEETATLIDSHPRRAAFFLGDLLVDINDYPEYFPGSAPTSLFRKEAIDQIELRFDERIKPNFEDGHFSARYVLETNASTIGYLSSAKYYYRKRADNSSTLQNSTGSSDRYLLATRYGHLDILQRSTKQLGYVPRWLQNFILYEMSYYFSPEDAISGSTAATGAVADEFVQILQEITDYLDTDVIVEFPLRRGYKGYWREILAHSIKQHQNWHSDYVLIEKHDKENDEIKISYLYSGEAPILTVLSEEHSDPIITSKTRTITYFDRDFLTQQILWLKNSRSLHVELDGIEVPLEKRKPIRGGRVRWAGHTKPATQTPLHGNPTTLPLLDRFRIKASNYRIVKRWFHNSWLFSDRLHDAADSAEVTFKKVRSTRPDIRSFFIIEKGTPDYKRLKKEGYGRYLLNPGSLRWHAAMRKSSYFISSHLHQIPPITRDHYKLGYKTVFLQHGVIKDDLSRYLNARPIDLMITSTIGEQASIVDNGTPYIYTDKESKLTGLPRFDELLAAQNRVPDEQRNLILIAPTWREWLNKPKKTGSQRRELVDDFLETNFAVNWLQVLHSPELAAVAEEQGFVLGFLPHPNLADALEIFPVPDYIKLLSFTEDNVQDTFARARMIVTDYSSMAFNVAYLNQAVVYFQFDFDEFHSGDHPSRVGYFSYEDDGFGPVAYDVQSAINAAIAAAAAGGNPALVYQERIDNTFPMRDGRCTERVVTEIFKLG